MTLNYTRLRMAVRNYYEQRRTRTNYYTVLVQQNQYHLVCIARSEPLLRNPGELYIIVSC